MKEQFYYRANDIFNKGIFELLEMGTQFAIRVEKDIYYCVIEQDSIFMYKNSRGFESWVELINQEDDISDLKALELEYMKYGLSLSFSSIDELSKSELKELKNLGIDYRNMSLIPRFRCHDELTLPYRVKEFDYKAIDYLLITLNDIIDENYTLFEDERNFFESESDDIDDDLLEKIKTSTICNNKVVWDEIDFPDDFERYPSPSLNEREASSYRKCKSNDKEWNLHLFIVPNANESASHVFPIAGALFDSDSKKILGYRLTKNYDEYCEDFLVELLDAIDDFGKPEIINVSSSRAMSLIKKVCEQLDISVQEYSSFEDVDTMEVQLIKNFNY